MTPFIVVGLGNPDTEYADTRHNVGFRVVDELAKRWSVRLRRRWHSRTAETEVRGKNVVLAQPLTFMNSSGLAVGAILRARGAEPERLLIVCDDWALPLGRLRLRRGGSDGGHKGLRSIVEHIHTDEFARLRLGIGHPGRGNDAVEYVLSPFEPQERETVETMVARAADCVEAFVREGIQAAMDAFNPVAGDATPNSERG